MFYRTILFSVVLSLAAAPFSRGAAQATPKSDSQKSGPLKQGDAQATIEALRDAVKKDKSDDTAWHSLGLAYASIGDTEKAKDAFKEAATLRLSKLLAIGPLAFPSDQSPTTTAKQAQQYASTIESIERYVAMSSSPDYSLTVDLDALRFYRDFYSGVRTDERIVYGKEVTTKLRILSKPPPDYSRSQASGVAILRAVLSADGTVKHVVMLRKVEPVFDQACREAATRIRFTPATKDGQPVSTILQLEYSRRFF